MSRRLADGIGLAAACLIGILALQANSGFFHDDGYIGLRYVRHWLAGHGLRWNIGWPPVEGYSNFLYLAAIAPLGHVGIDLAWAARLVNGAAWLGTAALLGRLGAWPAAGVLASLPLTVWTLGGLETPFYAFWVCAGTMASLRAWHRGTLWSWAIAALPLALACMARPDGAVFVAGATAFLGYGLSRDQIQPRCLLAFGGVLALVLLPYAAWKLAYYGDIFPNTFYAKAGGFDAERVWRGLRYVGSYLIRPPYLYLLAGVATVYAWRRRALNAPLVFVGATIGIYLTDVTQPSCFVAAQRHFEWR
jgi:arabinofuranosyltransferase